MAMYGNHILAQVRKQRVMHDVTLELTYKCNLDCFFCYNDRLKKGVALSLENYSKLLHDLAEMQTLYLMLTGGEPMIHPHFFEIGAIAKELGFVVTVRTNGHSLSPKNARRLRDEVDPYCVEVSLHGATAESHDKQTRIAGSFDKLVKNIGHCTEVGLNVSVVSTPTAWNEHQLQEMSDLCDSLGVPLRFQGPVAPRDDGDLTPLQITPKKETWDAVEKLHLAKLRKTQAPGSPVPEIKEKSIEIKIASIGKPIEEPKSTCSVGVAGVDIDPYGNVQACMHLQESAGNVHDNSIQEIWNDSPLFTRARQRAIDAAKRFKDKSPRQLGAHLHCLAVEENLAKTAQGQAVLKEDSDACCDSNSNG
jgi:MoaA/NifB/PqqE/SkfB family radical SAM enzyme